MPRYVFHLYDDDDAATDGVELPDLTAAREYARREVMHMAAASVAEHGRLYGEHRIDVEDQAGEVLFSVFFRDVVEIKP
jgi:hypothetical protein